MKPIYFSYRFPMIFPYFSQEIFPADFPMIFPTMNLHSQKIFARSTPSSWPTAPFWVGRQWRASGLVRKFEEIAKESWRMMKTLYVTCLFNIFVICLHHFFGLICLHHFSFNLHFFLQSSIDQDGASQIQLEKLDVLDISLSLPPRSSMTPDR